MEFTRLFPGGEMWPVISSSNEQQEAYEQMRRAGESHNIAEMLALQVSPQANTDSTFLAGHCNGNQFESCPGIGDFYKREADAAGVSITGKVYKSSLAAFPGDPRAWISSKDDVKNLCEERGWGCKGSVEVKVDNTRTPIADIDVADDIVEQKMMANIDKNPDLLRLPYRDVFDEAKEQIKPPKDVSEPTFQECFDAALAAA